MIYKKIKSDPIGFFKRGIFKKIIGPMIYKNKDGYQAGKYWEKRLKKYKFSLKGAGDEGLSEEDNKEMYEKAFKDFLDVCSKENINLRNCRILDIGCGGGHYTKLLFDNGAKDYTGVDITDALFGELKRKFKNFKFIKADITKDKIEGQYDLVLMIDVIEHIVTEDKLNLAMENVKKLLSDKGNFILSPVADKGNKLSFYVRLWSFDEIKKIFKSYSVGEPYKFREASMLIIKKG